MKNLILHTTIFSVFSEALRINYVIDIKLFYLIIFLNFILIATITPVKLSKKILWVLTILFGLGVLGVFLNTNTYSRVFSQIIGISIISLYYYNFFKLEDRPVDYYFKIYSYYALAIALIGVLIFFFNILIFRQVYPLKSIMLEPAHFATVMLPACYYFFKHITDRLGLIKFLILFISIILSFSSLGFLGLMLGIFLLPKRINLLRIFIPLILGIALAIALFKFVPAFNLRVTDTFNSIVNKDLENANLSSYSFVSNAFVALESFKHNPVMGGGLGSHLISHDKFIAGVTGSESFGDMIDLNAQDANSLFIRIVSELGLIGIIGLFYFLIKNYTGQPLEAKIITRAILLYFFCKLLREGHYFSPEMYFFVLLYFYNKKSQNNPKLIEDAT